MVFFLLLHIVNREIISPIMPLATTQHETTSVRLSMNKEWLMEHDYEWYTPPQMATDRPFPGQWVIGTKTSSMSELAVKDTFDH